MSKINVLESHDFFCTSEDNLKNKLVAAEKKLADLELVIMYANDIVNGWHTLTFRKVGVEMTPKVLSLGQALESAGVKTK
jgi:hypothetical protein